VRRLATQYRGDEVNARQRLVSRMAEWIGFDLERGGRLDVLERMVDRRAQALGLPSAEAYVASLTGVDDPEVLGLLETVTVGLTWFFRDNEQMEAIGTLIRTGFPAGAPLCAWVAGCSTGEEAYTLALLSAAAAVPLEVLGTDVNPHVLERARRARYSEWSVRHLPPGLRKHFHEAGGLLELAPSIRARVRFERHNLMAPPPRAKAGDKWHVILCRNVLIYFQRAAAQRTIEALTHALAPGGWLFLGASEVLHAAPPGCTIARIGARIGIQRLPLGAQAKLPAPPMQTSWPVTLQGAPTVTKAGDLWSGEGAASPGPSRAAATEQTLTKALARLEAGDNEEVIQLCARALEADPLCVEAHVVSGIAFHMSGDLDAALRSLRSALLLDAESWVASFYLGQTHERLGQTAEAGRAYRQAEKAVASSTPSRLHVLEAYRDEIGLLVREKVRRLQA
jgi:chemotaxis protein methyltransferase CheR